MLWRSLRDVAPESATLADDRRAELIYPDRREIRAWPSFGLLDTTPAGGAEAAAADLAASLARTLGGSVSAVSASPSGRVAALWTAEPYPPWYRVVISSGPRHVMTPDTVRVAGGPRWAASGELAPATRAVGRRRARRPGRPRSHSDAADLRRGRRARGAGAGLAPRADRCRRPERADHGPWRRPSLLVRSGPAGAPPGGDEMVRPSSLTGGRPVQPRCAAGVRRLSRCTCSAPVTAAADYGSMICGGFRGRHPPGQASLGTVKGGRGARLGQPGARRAARCLSSPGDQSRELYEPEIRYTHGPGGP